VPDVEQPVYARVLAYRPHAGEQGDPLSQPDMNLEHLRVIFSTTPRLRRILHRLFALYALAEVTATTAFGIMVLWSQHDVVYTDVLCAGSGSGDPCIPARERETPTDMNPTHELTPEHAEQLRQQQALQKSLADGQALFVWAQINIVLNSMLFCLNCAVGKYPLGDQQLPSYRFNRRLRSFRGTVKMLSMLWYGAGSFVVWKADPRISPPLFQYCTCVLLLTVAVWAWGCIVGTVARRCPKAWLRLLYPLLRRNLLTVSVSRAISPQRELDMVLEMSFQEEQARQRAREAGGSRPRRRPVVPDGYSYRRDEDYADQQTECAICLEDFEENVLVVSLQCEGAHTFHKDCIETWLAHEGVCPLCKFELPTVPIVAPPRSAVSRGEAQGEPVDADGGNDASVARRRARSSVRLSEAVATGPVPLAGRLAGSRRDDFGSGTGPDNFETNGGVQLTLQLGQHVDLGGLSMEQLGLDVQVQEFLLAQVALQCVYIHAAAVVRIASFELAVAVCCRHRPYKSCLRCHLLHSESTLWGDVN
jgi:hypothetical protein